MNSKPLNKSEEWIKPKLGTADGQSIVTVICHL